MDLDKVFRAYDVRGKYGEELTEEAIKQIATGFAAYLKEEAATESPKVVVGRDTRQSSPAIFKTLTTTLGDEGLTVIDIGLATSPLLYFAVRHKESAAGIQITASHNPPGFNGLKFVDGNAESISHGSGLEKIKQKAQQIHSSQNTEKGELLKDTSVLQKYIDTIIPNNVQRFKDLKAIIDTGNAVPGILINALKERTPIEIEHLFSELRGDFPNHDPDPVQEENIETLRTKMKNGDADIGIAFDGDGDRIAFVDENGNLIPSDHIMALVTEEILKEQPGETIVYTVISSDIIKDVAHQNGGAAVHSKVGRAFVPQRMRDTNAIFGGEYSGHFFHRTNGYSEAPFFVMFTILKRLHETDEPLSQLMQKYKKYAYSGVINFEIDEKQQKMQALKTKYSDGDVTEIDGIRIDYDDWWFIARPSNTEDLLRIAVEADEKTKMHRKINEIKTELQQ